MDCLERTIIICRVLIIVAVCVPIASTNVDIDYTHDVAGNGTVMTDYRMGDQQTSVATGAIRGTGNLVNSYSFFTNNSSDLSVHDSFSLTKTTEKATIMAARPNLPPWPGNPGRFKLVGISWARNIEIVAGRSSQKYNGSDSDSSQSTGSKSGLGSAEGGGEFKFLGSSQEGTSALAVTHISGKQDLDVNAFMDSGQAIDSKEFYYRTSWQNSSNVSVRSIVGVPRAVLYEEDALISGDSTGHKRLNIFAA